MNMEKNDGSYFEILRSLKKGGLSLYLNRKALLPISILPIIVTFITLTVVRAEVFGGSEELSLFMLAIIQAPADFIVGLFSSLIMVIIMNAPSKKDKDAPVMFSLNIMEKKQLMLAGAIAHMVFGYMTAGLYGLMDMVATPLQAIADQGETIPMGQFILLFLLLLIGFYCIRFMLLPILLVADFDVIGFFKNFKGFGLSGPVFLVKAATTIVAGILIYFPASILMMGGGDAEQSDILIQGIIDFITAGGSVIATAWGYAALSIGLRQMIERT